MLFAACRMAAKSPFAETSDSSRADDASVGIVEKRRS